MHRGSVDRKAVALSLLYLVLAVLRDLTIIAVMTYLISWEVKATRTLNFADTRTLGVTSRKTCDTPASAYRCGVHPLNLTRPSDWEVAANVSSLPICYSGTLKTRKSKSQELSLCFDDINTAYSYGEIKEYDNENTMPTSLQCAYNIDNAGSDIHPLETSMLSAAHLEIMFPPDNTLSRNYFPFATLIIALCCLALIMRMTRHLPSRAYPNSNSNGNSNGNSRSRGTSSSSNISNARYRSSIERDIFRDRGAHPSRRRNVWGGSAEKAEADMVTRSAVALNLLVACLLLASASQLSLIQVEQCPLNSDQAIKQSSSYAEKPFTEAQFYAFCNALRDCHLEIRSVISIDGSSAMDRESSTGFGYRRVVTLLACLLLSLVGFFLVSAWVMDWLFEDDPGNVRWKWWGASRHRGPGARSSGGPESITRITVRRARGTNVSWYRRVLRTLKFEETPAISTSPNRRSLRNSTSVSAEGYRNRVPRAGGTVSSHGATGDGRSASYLREYGDETDDFDFGNGYVQESGYGGEEDEEDPGHFRFTITSFASWESREKLRRRNLLLVGLYLGYDPEEVRNLVMKNPRGICEEEEDREDLTSPDSADVLESSAKWEDSTFSASLMLLYFDGENMCPICLQRFQAKSELRQQQLNQRIKKIKDMSTVVGVTSVMSSSNASAKNSSTVVAFTPGHHDEDEELDRAIAGVAEQEESAIVSQVSPLNDLGLEVEAATVWTFPASPPLTETALASECPPCSSRLDSLDSGPLPLDGEEKEGAVAHKELHALLADETVPELDLGETPYILPCGHCFHRCCLYQWLQESLSCPVCRCVVSTA